MAGIQGAAEKQSVVRGRFKYALLPLIFIVQHIANTMVAFHWGSNPS